MWLQVGFINKLGKFEKLGTSRAQAANLQCKLSACIRNMSTVMFLIFCQLWGWEALGIKSQA